MWARKWIFNPVLGLPVSLLVLVATFGISLPLQVAASIAKRSKAWVDVLKLMRELNLEYPAPSLMQALSRRRDIFKLRDRLAKKLADQAWERENARAFHTVSKNVGHAADNRRINEHA